MNSISTADEAIIREAGGSSAAKVLCRSKIVEVENKLIKVHSYGIIHIKAFDLPGVAKLSFSNELSEAVAVEGTLRISYKNENIYAERNIDSGETEIIASVPDLIAILICGSDRAIDDPEVEYGHRIVVIGISCSPRWADTAASTSDWRS